jgi:transglutaminase-like putative cysteine protease
VFDYSPGDQLLTSALENTVPVRQQIQFLEETSGILYTVGEPMSLDQDFQAAWRIYDVEDGIYDLFGVTVSEEAYRADSIITVNSEDGLRSAGQDYPTWVSDRYMNIPEKVPERVYTLARDLTTTAVNPYDRAIALENYLRTIPYTLDVDTAPFNQDIVDYFLFDLQKGYCDYYATAMVVLARAAGLPARYVTGYIGENFDEINQVYIITADQAHAWTEIYFPGYGWIPFEPTPGRVALERLTEQQPRSLPDDFELNMPPLVPESRFSMENGPQLVGLTIFLILILALLVWFVSEVMLYLTPKKSLPEKVFRRLYGISHRIGIPLNQSDTPYDYARKLNRYLDILHRERWWSGWMLARKSAINKLADTFVMHLFSPFNKDLFNRNEFLREYKRIRSLLWLLWILTKLYRLKLLRPILGGSVRGFILAIQVD